MLYETRKILLLLAATTLLTAGCAKKLDQTNSLPIQKPTSTNSGSAATSDKPGEVLTNDKKTGTPTSQMLEKDASGRFILIPGNYDAIPEICSQNYNPEPSSTEVTYRSIERGLSLRIPYNPNWGNKKYSVPPYYEMNQGQMF